MKLSGWGRYPVIESEVLSPSTTQDIAERVSHSFKGIARGLGRSYGDSSLASQVINLKGLNKLIEFNPDSGRATFEAGTSLKAINTFIMPQGWFLPVTPGTQYVTLGGAVASDVHGKNHHVAGTFGEHVVSLTILLASGEVVTCSKHERSDLFLATCGGMGLTGIILSVTFDCLRIQSSMIDQTTHKASHIEQAFELFEAHKSATYSVAWIDCLAKGKRLGRSHVMLGEHATEGALSSRLKKPHAWPMGLAAPCLNSLSIKAFNELYYHRQWRHVVNKQVSYAPFFYPLDGIKHWNKMYGSKGFLQFQCVVPEPSAKEGLIALLKRIALSGDGSFLAVLKKLGEQNDHYLSFPKKGYTLALDFKRSEKVLKLFNELNAMVLDFDGRLYLTKDAHMSEATFKQSYPQWEAFAQVRATYGAHKVFHSAQSTRLGL